MESLYWPIIQQAYEGFNNRDIDKVFQVMDLNVFWPKAFEGGYVKGYDEVRAYWLRQWSEIIPIVEPQSMTKLSDGRVEVLVHQLVKDLDGTVIFNGPTKHLYTFKGNIITQMDIEM